MKIKIHNSLALKIDKYLTYFVLNNTYLEHYPNGEIFLYSKISRFPISVFKSNGSLTECDNISLEPFDPTWFKGLKWKETSK